MRRDVPRPSTESNLHNRSHAKTQSRNDFFGFPVIPVFPAGPGRNNQRTGLTSFLPTPASARLQTRATDPAMKKKTTIDQPRLAHVTGRMPRAANLSCIDIATGFAEQKKIFLADHRRLVTQIAADLPEIPEQGYPG